MRRRKLFSNNKCVCVCFIMFWPMSPESSSTFVVSCGKGLCSCILCTCNLYSLWCCWSSVYLSSLVKVSSLCGLGGFFLLSKQKMKGQRVAQWQQKLVERCVCECVCVYVGSLQMCTHWSERLEPPNKATLFGECVKWTWPLARRVATNWVCFDQHSLILPSFGGVNCQKNY